MARREGAFYRDHPDGFDSEELIRFSGQIQRVNKRMGISDACVTEGRITALSLKV